MPVLNTDSAVPAMLTDPHLLVTHYLILDAVSAVIIRAIRKGHNARV